MADVRSAGETVERILDKLSTRGGPDVTAAAEELVRTVVDLYGAGLSRIMEIAAETDPALVLTLADDPLVGSLLLVHDLHPVDVDTRIQRALDKVRPYLGSHAGGVAYVGVDGEGVARLTLEGSCHGCPSSAVTVQNAIERAVQEAAPEIVRVEVAGQVPAGAGLLQIARRPEFLACPEGVAV